jgi:hypothetical protein
MAAEVKRLEHYLGAAALAVCLLAASSALGAPANAERPAAVRADNPAVAVQQVPVPGPGIRDEAAMILVGAALIGLASAVRRAA